MADRPHEDVTSTLSELERKLIELERELLTVAGGPAAGVPPIGTPPAPAPGDGTLRAEIDELIAVRDRLRTLTDELIERCERLADRLEPPAPGASDAPPPGAAPSD
ncbi:MAG TPA: hypothetical protein VFB41_11010 [Solirubrobacteraceae bacterium]|nr:hypothetical protein [Solirubrobacteraceae bacterium]